MTDRLRSQLCTEASFTSPALTMWAERLRPAWFVPGPPGGGPPLHRKLWEWCFIAEALHERGMLAPGCRGLGFGVGREPLSALFASFGCDIVATDLPPADARRAGWVRDEEHVRGLADLDRWPEICDHDTFARHVSYRSVDMRRVPSDLLVGDFDFTWSSCALEHLGSIVHGQDFVLRQLHCLRDGGVGVHTTEYNVSSATQTLDYGDTVLFRARDVGWLADALRVAGHHIDVDLDTGDGATDGVVAEPPYGMPHLKVRMGGYVTTSLGLIVTRGAPAVDAPRELGRTARRAVATGLRTLRRVRPAPR